LPVPDSPISRTRASERAARVACSTARVQGGLAPIICGPLPPVPQPFVLALQRSLFQGILESQQDTVPPQRFLQEVEGPSPRSLYGVGNRAVARDHHAGRRCHLTDGAQHINPAAVGQRTSSRYASARRTSGLAANSAAERHTHT